MKKKRLTLAAKIVFVIWSLFALLGSFEDIVPPQPNLIYDIITWLSGCLILVVPVQLISQAFLVLFTKWKPDHIPSFHLPLPLQRGAPKLKPYNPEKSHLKLHISKKPAFWRYRVICTPSLPIHQEKIRSLADARINRIPQNEMYEVDRYSGDQFEKYIVSLMVAMGYTNVQQTAASGDYGVDVIGIKNGIRYGVQCKRYSKSVGVKAVSQVVGGLRHWGCDKGIVVTNNLFTTNAQTLAADNGVRLIDRWELLAIIQANSHNIFAIRRAVNEQLDLYSRWVNDRDRKTFWRKTLKYKTGMDWSDVLMGICSALVPPGEYVIGTDIPEGKYDVNAYYGDGHITLFEGDGNTIKVNATIGTINEKLYYARSCQNLDCKTGDVLLVELVKVELVKHEPIEFIEHEE